MATPSTPGERRLQARSAAFKSWANTPDRSRRTAPARERFLSRFEDEVDPDRALPDDERTIRAEFALKAHMASLARASAKKRRRS